MKKTARLPTSEAARRLAAIFHRAPTTKWNVKKEIPQFRELVADGHFESLEGLAMVERYYKANWPPRHGKNSLRTDLATLLNNFQGELDRAQAWCELHPEKPIPKKIIQMPPAKSEPFIPSADEVASMARFEQYRKLKKASQ